MSGLFSDNLRMRMSGHLQNGVNIHLVCPECGRELKVNLPWNEVASLLRGGPAPGVQRVAPGIFVFVIERHGLGAPCITKGTPTRIPVRFKATELQAQWMDHKGRA
jgi:hypothetical protein